MEDYSDQYFQRDSPDCNPFILGYLMIGMIEGFVESASLFSEP